MNIALGRVLVLVVVGLTSGLMLVVRRRAPEGSYFSDGDHASGVFGVLATRFFVLLAFIIVLGFQASTTRAAGVLREDGGRPRVAVLGGRAVERPRVGIVVSPPCDATGDPR